jgi:hypothetical protein
VFDLAKDWFVCCWTDPDRIWEKNNEKEWNERYELGAEGKGGVKVEKKFEKSISSLSL